MTLCIFRYFLSSEREETYTENIYFNVVPAFYKLTHIIKFGLHTHSI